MIHQMMKWLIALVLLIAPHASWGQTYTATPVPGLLPAFPTTGTPLNLGDDNVARVTLPFTFEYYNQPFTQAWISSNGFLSFNPIGNGCCNGYPATSAPRNTIYGVWADLISYTGNPVTQTMTSTTGLESFVVGWYGTKEYGTNNSETFQIVLNNNDTFDIRYGALALSGHTFLAGFTGPSASDNYQIAYGRSIAGIANTGYRFSPKVLTVDCSSTPLDPSCASVPSVMPTVTPTVTATVQAETPVVAEAPVETPVVTQTQTVQVVQAVQPVDTAPAQDTTASVTASVTPVATATVAVVTPTAEVKVEAKAAAPERLSPAQLAALTNPSMLSLLLSPGAPSPASAGPATVAPTVTVQAQATQSAQTQQADTTQSNTSTSASAGAQFSQTVSVVSTASSAAQPASSQSQSQQATATLSQQATLDLVMPRPAPTSSTPAPTVSAPAVGPDQSGTMTAMADVPGFSQYAQATIPDRPDFYRPVQPYPNNRPVDAYMALYRMTMTNDRVYTAMTEAQYGR